MLATRTESTIRIIAAATLLLGWTSLLAVEQRVKDLASVAGVRSNQLIGYGLVVGLDGTGDQTTQTPFTVQSLRSMLNQLGVRLDDNARLQLKNIAAVAVHASLDAFSKPGQTLDITVASLGNAKSLRGGSLMMTPLKGADGKVYAIAQGNLVVGGFGVQGSDGSSIKLNIPSTGRIPNGATVEMSVPSTDLSGPLRLNLNTPDFTTASRLVRCIEEAFGSGQAEAIDPVTVVVQAPPNASQRVQFVSILENLVLEPGEPPARVVVNARTGTIVIGGQVRVLPAAIAHGGLTVTINESPEIVQPAPFGQGVTAVQPASELSITEDGGRLFLMQPGARLSDIVTAVNQVGAAPGDLIAILEALRQAGALKAEFIVI